MNRRTARRTSRRFVSVSALLAAVVLLTAGCASLQGGSREKSSQELYEEGNRLAARKDYPEAIEAYREAARTYRSLLQRKWFEDASWVPQLK